MSTIDKLVSELKEGWIPSNDQVRELMYSLHEALTDEEIYLWLTPSFEDMGDVVARAMRCIKNDDLQKEEDLRVMQLRFAAGRSIISEE